MCFFIPLVIVKGTKIFIELSKYYLLLIYIKSYTSTYVLNNKSLLLLRSTYMSYVLKKIVYFCSFHSLHSKFLSTNHI